MQIELNAGEYVVQVLGTHGQGEKVADLIRSLKFITNKTTYGPYGNTSGGTSFASSNEGRVVGFFGRSGDLLDQLGAIVAPTIIFKAWLALSRAATYLGLHNAVEYWSMDIQASQSSRDCDDLWLYILYCCTCARGMDLTNSGIFSALRWTILVKLHQDRSKTF